MSTSPAPIADYEAIEQTVGCYCHAATTGCSSDMRPAFHEDAQIFGYLDGKPFFGPIQILFDWDDAKGPATGVRTRITSIDLVGTIATARLEIENWHGYRFSDLFNLVKVDGTWKIMNKVFHAHTG